MRKVFIFFMIAATILSVSSQFVFAQSESVDAVTLMNGSEMKGKVTGITDDAITFVHQGETLAYVVKKEEINKIKFASGRVEIINEIKEQPKSGNSATKLTIQRNLVAVLPFVYIGQGRWKRRKIE